LVEEDDHGGIPAAAGPRRCGDYTLGPPRHPCFHGQPPQRHHRHVRDQERPPHRGILVDGASAARLLHMRPLPWIGLQEVRHRAHHHRRGGRPPPHPRRHGAPEHPLQEQLP
ncbi:Os09g0566400, partial [Oryza sativa Japonica Group]